MKLLFISSCSVTLGLMALLSLSAFASGVSGGGGNVMFPVDPKNPAPLAEVQAKVGEARGSVASYFEAKQELFQKGNLSAEDAALFGPLLQAGKGMVAVARETGVDIEQKSSCFDSAATPVDGSIISDHRGEVCVSALSISKRVERRDVPAQSAALLAHEFTEVLGFGEDEAVRVQSKVLADFRGQQR